MAAGSRETPADKRQADTHGWAFWRDATKRDAVPPAARVSAALPFAVRVASDADSVKAGAEAARTAARPAAACTGASLDQGEKPASGHTVPGVADSPEGSGAMEKINQVDREIPAERKPELPPQHTLQPTEVRKTNEDPVAPPVVVRPDWAAAQPQAGKRRAEAHEERQPAKRSEPKAASPAAPHDDWPPGDFRIHVSNLGPDVDDALLRAAFAPHGTLTGCRVVRERRTGRPRGYGFVGFADVGAYVAAMRALDGRYVGSRPVRLRRSEWSTGQLPPA